MVPGPYIETINSQGQALSQSGSRKTIPLDGQQKDGEATRNVVSSQGKARKPPMKPPKKGNRAATAKIGNRGSRKGSIED